MAVQVGQFDSFAEPEPVSASGEDDSSDDDRFYQYGGYVENRRGASSSEDSSDESDDNFGAPSDANDHVTMDDVD
jgi:hypothetical protein